jgi:hypothetical protein
MTLIFRKICGSKVATSIETFKVLGAWIYSKAIDAMAIWRSMESIRLNFKKV